MPDCSHSDTTWHKVADHDDLPDGRVKIVTVGRRSLALTHYQGSYGALDNHCPHQGGPLGEGSIEHGWLRCPWHGYDYNPLDGMDGFSDNFDLLGYDSKSMVYNLGDMTILQFWVFFKLAFMLTYKYLA